MQRRGWLHYFKISKMKKNIKKQDFILSGAVESGLMFYDTPMLGASSSIGESALIINKDGTSRFYLGKLGVEKAKNEWLKMPTKKIEQKFGKWREKWWKYEKYFYKVAVNDFKNPVDEWQKINKISLKYWRDSYKVEAIDSFADEIELQILKGLEKSGVDTDLFHDLITPSKPTLPQSMVLEGVKAISNQTQIKKFLRKFWFAKGNWAGGEILNKDDVSFAHENITDFKKLKKLHLENDKKIDSKTLQIIRLLRLQFIWREERKAFLQMMNVALWSIAKKVASKEDINLSILIWLRPEEIFQYKKAPEKFSLRAKKSIYFRKRNAKKTIIICGDDAQDVISEFCNTEKQKELKGTIASKGKITGIVRLILREHQFSRFNKGEILVTTMTRPEYLPLMLKAGGIITDEGGLTSHAAIVSRELKKPCIVGTKHATEVFEDGDLVEVDAERGVVKIIKRK